MVDGEQERLTGKVAVEEVGPSIAPSSPLSRGGGGGGRRSADLQPAALMSTNTGC